MTTPPRSEVPLTRLPSASVHDYELAAAERAGGRFGAVTTSGDGESAARMSAERAADFRGRLTSLVNEYFGPAAAIWSEPVKYGFRWYLGPVDLAPADDDRVDPELRASVDEDVPPVWAPAPGDRA